MTTDLPKAYRDYLTIDPKRLVAVTDTLQLEGIKCAIVFVLAKWSGASQLSFRALNKGLCHFDVLEDLVVLILDIDTGPAQEFFEKINQVPAGVGETFWIKRGKILRTLGQYSDVTTVIDYTRELLSR